MRAILWQAQTDLPAGTPGTPKAFSTPAVVVTETSNEFLKRRSGNPISSGRAVGEIRVP